jgi:hypothetical protein
MPAVFRFDFLASSQGLGFAKQSGLYPRTTLTVKIFFRLFRVVRRLNPSHEMELYFPN